MRPAATRKLIAEGPEGQIRAVKLPLNWVDPAILSAANALTATMAATAAANTRYAPPDNSPPRLAVVSTRAIVWPESGRSEPSHWARPSPGKRPSTGKRQRVRRPLRRARNPPPGSSPVGVPERTGSTAVAARQPPIPAVIHTARSPWPVAPPGTAPGKRPDESPRTAGPF
jgi:hypothetical protein